MLSMVFFALSLSLDAIGVGLAYGLKKIKILPSSWLFMSLISLMTAFLAVALGKFFYQVLPDRIGSYISILMLLAMGITMIKNAVKKLLSQDTASRPEPKPKQKQYVLHILGLTITVMQDPSRGDFDGSKRIEPNEAAYLGLALSLDAIGAGIGYAMSSASILLFPVCISLFQFLFLRLGIKIGTCFTAFRIHESFFSFLPGIIMIFLAVLRLFG